MEVDMNSIAQHAVANGYGKIEYFRAQPIAFSTCVTITLSLSSASGPAANPPSPLRSCTRYAPPGSGISLRFLTVNEASRLAAPEPRAYLHAMEIFRELATAIEFSSEKMKKNGVFASERFFCDVYAFEP